MSDTFIHNSSIVEDGAILESGVYIGPFCHIGSKVRIKSGTIVKSHVSVWGNTEIGSDNIIFPFASIGHDPQDLKFHGEDTVLIIGNRNKIRECATLQPGTEHGGGITRIGDDNLFMAYSHVAHDCNIGNSNVFANSVGLAGHVTIGNCVVVGGLSAVHQFCTIGDGAMLAANSMITQDLPPFCLAEGGRAALRGLNVVGLRRKGFCSETIMRLKTVYRIMFLAGFPTVQEAKACVEQEGLLMYLEVQQLVEAIEKSTRGVVRPSVN